MVAARKSALFLSACGSKTLSERIMNYEQRRLS